MFATPDGTPYMIKAGVMLDDHGRRYFFAIGRSLADSVHTVQKFTEDYFLSMLAIIPLTGLLGWVLAGRAIRPVNDVAQAAQKITGSNLSLQIPLRGAGDELDHLIESFNRMTTRLEDSFEQIRRFSTDVSHELRTPLTAIRGQLEVALFTAQTPEQYREAMVNALEDVEKLSSIVRALLLLSQAESGQLVLQKTMLDLGGVAEDVVDQFQIPAEEKQVRLTARIEPGVVILADRTQIERLFSNLLSNAVKYTPRNGTVQVRVRRRRKRLGTDRNRGYRRGHPGGKSAAHLRPFLSRAQCRNQPHSRTGAGPKLRGLDRESAWRRNRRYQHGGRRNAVHGPSAGGGSGERGAFPQHL